MKPVAFSKDSWHWRLAHKYGGAEEEYNTQEDYECTGNRWTGYQGDICDYMKHMLSGFFACLLITVAGCLVGFAISDSITWAIACYKYGMIEVGYGPVWLSAELAVILLWGSVYLYYTWQDNKQHKQYVANRAAIEAGTYIEPVTKNSIMSSIHRRIKDKTCFRVEVR